MNLYHTMDGDNDAISGSWSSIAECKYCSDFDSMFACTLYMYFSEKSQETFCVENQI